MIRPSLIVAVMTLTLPMWSQGRAIVIGVDGLDPAWCSRWMADGSLPELKALADSGRLSPLRPTNPAQSPVSWSSMVTGRDPGETGINDFLRRDSRGGEITAELSLVDRVQIPLRAPAVGLMTAIVLVVTGFVAWRRLRRGAVAQKAPLLMTLGGIAICIAAVGSWLPSYVEVPRNARGGEAIWERADRAGLGSVNLFAPMSFPAPQLDHGCVLCGLGVPDVMGTPGTATVYREEPIPGGRLLTPTGCRVESVREENGALVGPRVEGPKRSDGTRPTLPIRFVPDRARRTVSLTIGDGLAIEIPEGGWTPWVDTPLSLGPLGVLSAISRWRLVEGGARTVIYQEPSCFDPRSPMMAAPVVSPSNFGTQLLADGRAFGTLGWACATNPLQDEIIDESTFITQVEAIDAEREEMVMRSLSRKGWKLFFCVLSTPDRVQHVFYRDHDPLHPRHDASAIARRGDPMKDSYRRLDRLVGRVRREIASKDDLVMVVSDHGVAPFRWQVNLNRWLAEEGYLVGSDSGSIRSIEESIGGAALFPGVDWSQTRAYSMGLGKIYINVAGREPRGSVPIGERRRVLEEIKVKLLSLTHSGRRVVRSAEIREDLYVGDRIEASADLIVGFESGYRISWQATLGAFDEAVVTPNRRLWSGDHCSVDPGVVPGVLIASRPFDDESISVVDVFPTIEAWLALQKSPGLRGKALTWR